MLFGPDLSPERQKLRLIQLISQDTPSTPCEDGQRFCVLLRYEPDGSETRQILLEQEADQAMAQLGYPVFPSIMGVNWWCWCSRRRVRMPFERFLHTLMRPMPMWSPRR